MARMLRSLPVLLACLAAFSPAQGLTPAEWLWAIKTDSTLRLRQIPNFTCRESITARSRSARPGAPEQIQQTEVQVAMVNGQELFSTPHARGFTLTAPPALPLPDSPPSASTSLWRAA